ncbi:MAG: hypothetical protein HN870_10965, partial [Gammaproteobacteria bacterium]|nr:hypothetical protein [Gammaproteobacteria bacterium]
MSRLPETGDTPLRRGIVVVLLSVGVLAVVVRAAMLHLFPEVVSAKLPDRANRQHV